MQSITQQVLIDTQSEYNLLDLFLKVANSTQDTSEQVTPFELCETSFITKNTFPALKYSQIKKSNIIKNILKSFQRYIEDADVEEQETLLQISKKSYSYCQLKKTIKRNFKTFGKRWNMKLKYLVDKCTYKALFQFYLQNKSSNWLNLSKVQNKEDHASVIDFLKEAIITPEYCNKIKYYKKQRICQTQM